MMIMTWLPSDLVHCATQIQAFIIVAGTFLVEIEILTTFSYFKSKMIQSVECTCN